MIAGITLMTWLTEQILPKLRSTTSENKFVSPQWDKTVTELISSLIAP